MQNIYIPTRNKTKLNKPSPPPRFGHQLRTSLIKEYYWHYIAYDDLKTALKTPFESTPTPTTTEENQTAKPKRKPWTEEDERRFVALLESELDKVFTFQKLKSDEIVARIVQSEKEVHGVVAMLRAAASGGGGGGGGSTAIAGASVVRRDSQIGNGGVEAGSAVGGAVGIGGGKGPTDEDFLLLEEDLSDIIADVHDLAKYVQLNYTGFQKIIKKHDVSFSGLWFSLFSRYNSFTALGSLFVFFPFKSIDIFLGGVETNPMAPKTRVRSPFKSETVFQRQLRCVRG